MAGDVEEGIRDTLGIHSLSELFAGIGEWIDKSIGAGIKDGKQKLLETSKDLGIDTSAMTLQGITEGLAGGEGAVTKGITEIMELLMEKKSLKNVAKTLGVKTGDSFSGSLTESLKGGATKSAYSGIVKDAFEIFKESINKRKGV